MPNRGELNIFILTVFNAQMQGFKTLQKPSAYVRKGKYPIKPYTLLICNTHLFKMGKSEAVS